MIALGAQKMEVGTFFLTTVLISRTNVKGLKHFLRIEVRGDFKIHGSKYFYQKSKIYDVVSLLYLWWAQKTRPLHEILTRLVIIENAFIRCFQ